jgi:hypothetical protein
MENEWKMKRRREMEVRSHICSRTSRLITFPARELLVMIAEWRGRLAGELTHKRLSVE